MEAELKRVLDAGSDVQRDLEVLVECVDGGLPAVKAASGASRAWQRVLQTANELAL